MHASSCKLVPFDYSRDEKPRPFWSITLPPALKLATNTCPRMSSIIPSSTKPVRSTARESSDVALLRHRWRAVAETNKEFNGTGKSQQADRQRVRHERFHPTPTTRKSQRKRAYLDEADLGGALAEAATAHVQVVLADQTTGRVAHAAVAGVLAVVAWVGVLKVGHLDGCTQSDTRHMRHSLVRLLILLLQKHSTLSLQRDLRSLRFPPRALNPLLPVTLLPAWCRQLPLRFTRPRSMPVWERCTRCSRCM